MVLIVLCIDGSMEHILCCLIVGPEYEDSWLVSLLDASSLFKTW